MLCKVSKPPTSNIYPTFFQVATSWKPFDPLQMNMFPSKETNQLQFQEVVSWLPSIHAHVNCLPKFQIQANPYSHTIANVHPIVQVPANCLLYFYSHTSLVQLATNGTSDVENDLLFELEVERFIAHAKRLNAKKKWEEEVTRLRIEVECEKLKNKQLMEELERFRATVSKHFEFEPSF